MFSSFFQASRERIASVPNADKKDKCSRLYQNISTLKDSDFILLAHAISLQHEKVAESHWVDDSSKLCQKLKDGGQTCGAKRLALKQYLDGHESVVDCDGRDLIVSIIEAEVKKKISLYCNYEVINPCFEGGIRQIDAPPVNCPDEDLGEDSDEYSGDEFCGTFTFNGAAI